MPDLIMLSAYQRLTNKVQICLELLQTAMQDIEELQQNKVVTEQQENGPGER